MGAITHPTAPVWCRARAIASSWSVSTCGARRAIRRPRTPRAGLGSPFWLRNGSGLSALASSVRTTILRPAIASKTAA